MAQNVQVEGFKIRIVERGKGNPVILLHGLGGSIESWINNLHSLSREARVIGLDLPGFGQSDKHRISYTISFFRDFLIKFMEHLGLEKASMIGSPTLLIWGKDDIMIPARFVEPFLRMKNCRLVMLEHCGHRPHAERPAVFNTLVSGFLKEGA